MAGEATEWEGRSPHIEWAEQRAGCGSRALAGTRVRVDDLDRHGTRGERVAEHYLRPTADRTRPV